MVKTTKPRPTCIRGLVVGSSFYFGSTAPSLPAPRRSRVAPISMCEASRGVTLMQMISVAGTQGKGNESDCTASVWEPSPKALASPIGASRSN